MHQINKKKDGIDFIDEVFSKTTCKIHNSGSLPVGVTPAGVKQLFRGGNITGNFYSYVDNKMTNQHHVVF